MGSLAEMDMFLIAGAALAGLVFGLIANAVLRIRARQTDALKIEQTELILLPRRFTFCASPCWKKL